MSDLRELIWRLRFFIAPWFHHIELGLQPGEIFVQADGWKFAEIWNERGETVRTLDPLED